MLAKSTLAILMPWSLAVSLSVALCAGEPRTPASDKKTDTLPALELSSKRDTEASPAGSQVIAPVPVPEPETDASSTRDTSSKGDGTMSPAAAFQAAASGWSVAGKCFSGNMEQDYPVNLGTYSISFGLDNTFSYTEEFPDSQPYTQTGTYTQTTIFGIALPIWNDQFDTTTAVGLKGWYWADLFSYKKYETANPNNWYVKATSGSEGC